MKNEDFRIKELFNVPVHPKSEPNIFRVGLYTCATPWVFCIAGIITACVYFGGWAYFGLLGLIPCLYGVLLAFGNAFMMEQYYLYANSGIMLQLKIDVLCMKDEGFADFLKEHGKMSIEDMKKIIEKYKGVVL